MKNIHVLRTIAIVLVTLIALALGAMPPPVYAATARYVSPSGTNAVGCTNSASPCKTITYALTQAAAGDTINLAAGTYSVASNGETLPLTIAINLTINGAGASSTIMDGATSAQVMVVNGGVTVTLQNVTIANGKGAVCDLATGSGAGICNNGNLTVSNSVFSNNNASNNGGGISNGGSLTVLDSTFSNNSATNFGGGGIFNYSEVLTVTNSTFAGNSATNGSGGGIFNSLGTVTVTNSTLSGNSAKANSGGGVASNSGTATLRNTIVANSPAGGNCNGTITNGGGNLSYPDNTCPGINQDPKLGALANNGGLTQTMALGVGSAALDKIPNAGGCGVGITTDQRGVARPQPAGGLCDIGAYELQQAPVQAPAAPAEVPEADTLLLFGGGIGALGTWLGWQTQRTRARKK